MDIKLKIKPPNYYSYDEILDKYNETKDKKFLFYCFIKKNKLNIADIIKITDNRYDKVFVMIYNIQRELENEKPIKGFENLNIVIDDKFDFNDDDDDIDIEDILGDEEEDF